MIRSLLHFLRLEHIRHFMTLFSSSLLGQALALLLAPVLSRLFVPDDFGLAALYLSILSILSVAATAKYEQAIMLPRADKAAVHLFRMVIGLAAIVSAIVIVPVHFFNTGIAALFGNEAIAPWLYLLPFSLLIHGILQASIFYSNRTKAFSRMARTTLLQQAMISGVKVLAGGLRTSFNGLITGQIIGQALAALYIFGYTLRQIAGQRIKSSFKDIILQAKAYSQYPRFNMLLSMTNNLSGTLPIFMFTWGFSAEAAGLYAFGYTFVFRPVSLFSQSTQQVLSQKMIEQYHQGRYIYPALKQMVQRFFLAGIIPLVVFTIWAPELFSFVFSETYRTSGEYLQVLSPWLFMVFLTSPLTFLHELFFKQKTAMVIDLIYLVLRFLALYLGIRMQNEMIALILFSGVSTALVGYKLFWFLYLARRSNRITENKHPD